MRFLPALICLLPLLGACTDRLEQLTSQNLAETQASAFNAALASEYLAYSQSELEQSHFFASRYYAGKGLDAAQDKLVLPDELSTHEKDSDKLTLARSALMDVLTDDVKRVSPQKAARAQLLFDCWQQQAGSNDALAPCGDEFASMLLDLQSVGELFSGRDTLATSYRVSFADGASKLGASAQATIRSIARKAKAARDYSLTLDGHLSKAEGKPYAEQLAKARLENVRAALVSQGLQESHISLIHEKAQAAPVVLSSEAPPPSRSVHISLTTLSTRKTP